MVALVKIGLVLFALAVLTWRKLPVGLVLILSAAWLALLFNMTPVEIAVETCKGLVALDTLSLAALLFLVTFFGHVLKEVERIDGMLAALQDLIPSVRLNMVIAPAAVGLLPMPGGALLSAPMVAHIAERNEIKLAPERATVINYWFRHIWEYSFPLYPGIILLALLLDVPLRKVALANLPLGLFCIAVGAILYYRRLPTGPMPESRPSNRLQDVKQLAQNFWPIIVVVAASVGLGIPLTLCLAATSILLVVLHRLAWPGVMRAVRTTVNIEMVLLVLGVVIFKRTVEQSGCVPAVVDAFNQLRLPPPLLLFSVPFIVAFMTGITVSYVGVAVPILLPLLIHEVGGNRSVMFSRTMLLYAGGYYGLLLSPVHLCLILTKEYFGADLSKVYRLLVPGVVLVAVLASSYYLVLNLLGI